MADSVTCESLEDKELGKVILKCFHKVRTNPIESVRHSNEFCNVLTKVDKSVDSKKGTFYERTLNNFLAPNHFINLLKESKKKNNNFISIPFGVYEYIQGIYAKIQEKDSSVNLMNSESLQNIFKGIYDYSISYEVKKDEEMFETLQDLDLAFRENRNRKVYIYEVKKFGSFGADVSDRHFEKLFLTYADYIYNHKPMFEDVVLNFLLVDRELDDSFKHCVHGDFGWINLEEFCVRHTLTKQLPDIKKALHTGYTINDDFVKLIYDQCCRFTELYPEFVGENSNFSNFKKNFNVYYKTEY